MKVRFSTFTCLTLFLSLFISTSLKAENFNLDETIGHLSKSIDYANKANAIINKARPFSVMAVEDSEQMIMYIKKSLEEATMVNTDLLNSLYPTWGDRFKNDNIEGLKLTIKGHESANAQYSIEGQQKTTAYHEWFRQVRNNF